MAVEMEVKNPQSDHQPQLSVQQIYLKGAELKVYSSIELLLKESKNWKPVVDLKAKTDVHNLGSETHEAALSLEVSAKSGEELIYTVSIQQAGLFVLRNFDQDNLARVLHGYCMNVLYPYASEKINQLVTQSGFSSVFLAPMNFEQLYQEYLAQVEREKSKL